MLTVHLAERKGAKMLGVKNFFGAMHQPKASITGSIFYTRRLKSKKSKIF